MDTIIEMWQERHTTDSDNIAGNDHYIDHKIYITEKGDLIHERKKYRWDDYDCKYGLVNVNKIVLEKGLK